MLKNILTIVQVVISLALITVVMLQSGKEAGLSGAIAGNSDSYMNKNKRGGLDRIMATATKWVALVWVVLTLVLTLI